MKTCRFRKKNDKIENWGELLKIALLVFYTTICQTPFLTMHVHSLKIEKKNKYINLLIDLKGLEQCTFESTNYDSSQVSLS